MIATRMRLFPRRVVEAFFLFLAIAMTSDFYLSLIESWRPTWTTRRTNVIVERTARAKIAATKIASTSNTAHAARPTRKMTMRASRGAGPTRARPPRRGRGRPRGSSLRLGAVHEKAKAAGVELGELLPVERAADLAAHAFHPHDAGASQATQMPGHERLADAQAAGELRNRLLALGHQDLNDAQAVHVAERTVIASQLAQARLAEDGSPLHCAR